MAGASNPETVKTAEKTLRVIQTLREIDGGGVTEIAERTDMSKSNTYKYLRTLEEMEYVNKEGDEYRIGLRFLDLGEYARSNLDLYDIATPEIRNLAEETNEMANLMVEEHGYGVFVSRADSDRAVNLDTYAGKRVHLHTTAMGKAILAFLPEARVLDIVEQHGLPRMTDNTITERDALWTALDSIRERGYAIDDGERLEGLCCVAAPIRRQDGQVLGAISVSGPASRLKDGRFESEIPELVKQSQNIIELDVEFL